MPNKKQRREVIISYKIEGELWDAVMEGTTATIVEMKHLIPELVGHKLLRNYMRNLLLSFLSHLIIDGFIMIPNKKKK